MTFIPPGTYYVSFVNKTKEVRKKIVDFDVKLLEKGSVPYHYVIPDDLFSIKATVYGRGILIHKQDNAPEIPLDTFLRFRYKRMTGKFQDRNIFLIEITNVNDKVYKAFYVKLQTNHRWILIGSFIKKNLKTAITKALKSAWEIFTKHIFKIIIIAILTWLTLGGAKYFKKIADKIGFDNMMNTISTEITK